MTLLIVTATPQDPEAMQAYGARAGALLVAAGGELLSRGRVTDRIAGEPEGMSMVMRFPDADAVKGVFGSEAYAELLPLRERAFSSLNIAVAEEV
ncbi:MAG: DUF1330 domain-containing protein [Myxococcota bacterium]